MELSVIGQNGTNMKINDISHFGNCIGCHRHLVHNKVVGGKVEGVLHADASDSFFKLNNGSILVVPICKPCKATMNLNKPAVHKKIWEAVNLGWQLEINHMKEHPEMFKEFTVEKEESLKALYASLNIVSHEPNHKAKI